MPLDELCRLTDLLLKAALVSAGYHQHNRGEWRRRKHVSEPTDNTRSVSTRIDSASGESSKGDLKVMPELKKAFDEHPELAEQFGDLVRHAQDSLLTLVAGSCLTAREAIARQASALRDRLIKTAMSELEKLLVDRVVISWIEVYHGDISLAQHLLQVPGAAKTVQAAQQRLDRAHARYLSAIKALATTHKLLRLALSPLDLAVKFVPEEKAGAAGLRPAVAPAEGVPVLN